MVATVSAAGTVTVSAVCVVPDQFVEVNDMHVEVVHDGMADAPQDTMIAWLTTNEWPSPMPVSADGLAVE